MATHQGDVSVSFCVPADPVGFHVADRHQMHAPAPEAARPTAVADSDVPEVVGLRLPVALARLRERGVDAVVRATNRQGPVGVVIEQQPGEGSAITLDVVIGTPVRVPDVVLESEVRARARIEAAGLEPGRRAPAPRPARQRSEVVLRTRPRAGTLVQAGSTVDYELLPGEPRRSSPPAGYIDHDAASSLDPTASAAAAAPIEGGAQPYVDFDVIDTVFQLGSRPVEGQA